MKPKLLLMIMILMCSSQACGNQTPHRVEELAISALCDFPAFSGENLCQWVEITNVIVEDTSISASQSEEKSKKWCIELKFIDFTGNKVRTDGFIHRRFDSSGIFDGCFIII